MADCTRCGTGNFYPALFSPECVNPQCALFSWAHRNAVMGAPSVQVKEVGDRNFNISTHESVGSLKIELPGCDISLDLCYSSDGGSVHYERWTLPSPVDCKVYGNPFSASIEIPDKSNVHVARIELRSQDDKSLFSTLVVFDDTRTKYEISSGS